MTFELIYFACTEKDEGKYLVVTDKQYDNYVRGEPQEGYHIFKWECEVELTQEVIDAVHEYKEEELWGPK